MVVLGKLKYSRMQKKKEFAIHSQTICKVSRELPCRISHATMAKYVTQTRVREATRESRVS